MKNNDYGNPEWREFERLASRIETDAAAHGWVVRSPDHVLDNITGKLREVDISIRPPPNISQTLITIECRKRRKRQDVTWIEQLASKRTAIGAHRTIAVSASGFSAEATSAAKHYGIDLRLLTEVTAADINGMMQLDFVWFTHKRAAIAKVGFRFYQDSSTEMSLNPSAVDCDLPPDANPFQHIFCNTKTGRTWSLNDMWLLLQETVDPFAGLSKFEPPVYRTACFPYPGNVTVETQTGSQVVGNVFLTIALWLHTEQISLEQATKIEYRSDDAATLQRVEFNSREEDSRDWRVSLQAAKSVSDPNQVKVSGNWLRQGRPVRK